VWDLTFSPDGHHLASSSGGQEVDVWDIDTGDPQTGDPRHIPAATEVVTSIRYSHDGRLLIVGDSDGSIAVIDSTSGIRVGPPMTGHTAAVQALALDPEGRLLVSVSSDGTAILWNFATHEALTEPLAGHPDRIFDATWIAEGSALVTAGRNATLLWDVRSGLLRKVACDVVGRDLTLSEWRSFLGSRSYETSCGP
jgi:WD40 repeat protein